MKHVFFIGVSVVIFLAGVDGCTDMGSDVPPAPVVPTIIGIQPDSAAVGDTVTVNGSNFGNTQSSSSVLFAPGIQATIVPPWRNTSIVVKVPSGAVTGSVSVSVNGKTSNGFQFKTSAAVDTTVSFNARVLPILVANCAVSGCHSGNSPIANFDPSTYVGLRNGGFSYHQNVVIPFDSTNSGLMKMIRGTNNLYNLRMPQKGQYFTTGLPDSMIVTIGTWIKQGALNN